MPVSGPAYFPWGDPHGYPYGPHPMGGVGDTLIEAAPSSASASASAGPVAILAGSHGDRPHCIYRGFCIQGCKVGAKQTHAHHARARRHRHTARRSAIDCMVARIDLARRSRHRRHLLRSRRHASTSSARAPSSSAATPSRRRACCSTRPVPAYEHGLANSSGTRRALSDGAGGQRRARALRRADPHVQGAARARHDRRVLRDRPAARLRARLRHSDRRAAAHRLRQADDGGQGRLGLGHAARDDGLQPLGDARRARRDPAVGRQPRRARRGEGSAGACPSPR